MNELINYKGVCRTALATPGLLKILRRRQRRRRLRRRHGKGDEEEAVNRVDEGLT